MENILAGDHGINKGSTTTTFTAPQVPPGHNEEVNLGLILPLIVLCIFLTVVLLCVIRHSCHQRNRANQYKLEALTSFYRSHGLTDDWRCSTRSTTPLKKGPYVPREFIPNLDRISESPEDKLREGFRRSGLETILSPEDSFTSVLSSLRFEIPSLSVHTPYLPSLPPPYISDMSHSFPNLKMAPQASFSPYHLTWMSPATGRCVYSDPNLVEDFDSHLRHSVGYNDISASASADGLTNSFVNRSWMSPYHPNFNTPTNGSDTDSNHFPIGIFTDTSKSMISPKVDTPIINKHKLATKHMTPPTYSANEMNLRRIAHRGAADDVLKSSRSTPTLQSFNSMPYVTPVTDRATMENGTYSCPSNVGSWHYNDIYRPFTNGQPPIVSIGQAGTWYSDEHSSRIEHISNDSSMCAKMGSSETSMYHTHVTFSSFPGYR